MMSGTGEYHESATLYRCTEAGIDHLVFEGSTGWKYRVYEDRVTEGELPKTLKHLGEKSWMNDQLLAEFEAAALLLRTRGASR